jgi:hypothetical protein
MARRRLDPAAAQQRLGLAIWPDEVVASVRASLGPARPRLDRILLIGLAALAAAAWATSPHPGPASILFSILLASHLLSLADPRRTRGQGDYLLALTRDRLLLADYPAATAPVRVIFAGPVPTLSLEVRPGRRRTTLICTAADDSGLVLFGKTRRKFTLVIGDQETARHVLEAFVSRGGIGPAAAQAPGALT